jgi:hypothetical protein
MYCNAGETACIVMHMQLVISVSSPTSKTEAEYSSETCPPTALRVIRVSAKLLWPTSWSKRPFVKLTLCQLFNNVPASYATPPFHNRVHNSRLLITILSQINPFHTLPSYFFKIYINIILLSKPRSSKWSLSYSHPYQNPV